MNYWYRVIKSTWGIAINIECEIDSPENAPQALLVGEGIYLDTHAVKPYNITPEDREYQATGIKMIAPQLQPILTEPIVIHVFHLVYSDCDFQVEGLAYAMAGWLAQHYQVNFQFPEVTFDKAQNRYQFPLP